MSDQWDVNISGSSPASVVRGCWNRFLLGFTWLEDAKAASAWLKHLIRRTVDVSPWRRGGRTSRPWRFGRRVCQKRWQLDTSGGVDKFLDDSSWHPKLGQVVNKREVLCQVSARWPSTSAQMMDLCCCLPRPPSLFSFLLTLLCYVSIPRINRPVTVGTRGSLRMKTDQRDLEHEHSRSSSEHTAHCVGYVIYVLHPSSRKRKEKTQWSCNSVKC